MPAFFIDSPDVRGSIVTVRGDLLHHLRASLRIEAGDTLYFTEAHTRRHRTRVLSVERGGLTATIEETWERPARRGPALLLAQAILKHDPMDWLVQKATELGVARIQPLLTRHGVVRPDAGRAVAQRARWQRIAREAAQQSERWAPPDVLDPFPIERWLTEHDRSDPPLVLEERRGASTLADPDLRLSRRLVTLVVGPEGGWQDAETALMRSAGVTSVGLGPNILRAETAALAAISILQSRLGQFTPEGMHDREAQP